VKNITHKCPYSDDYKTRFQIPLRRILFISLLVSIILIGGTMVTLAFKSLDL